MSEINSTSDFYKILNMCKDAYWEFQLKHIKDDNEIIGLSVPVRNFGTKNDKRRVLFRFTCLGNFEGVEIEDDEEK